MLRFLFALTVVFMSTVTACAETPVDELKEWLSTHSITADHSAELMSQAFAKASLTERQSQQAADLLWQARAKVLKAERKEEHEVRTIELNGKTMPFWFKVFGQPRANGRSLFISMHGGGGTAARVNDGQYENQKRLYQPEEGVYLVPRAPNNTWNLWHQSHIDRFFDRLITNMVLFEGVDPNRVYLMGYSAGGDGVYQLAPRMADRFAAASMMAGHPNETRPDGLRNLPFAIFMGGNDRAYQRNRHAAEWKDKLAAAQEADPEGYLHRVNIFEGMGHWMQRKDAVALPWMSKFERNRFPQKVVWLQDDVTHRQFYWLRTADQPGARVRTVVQRNKNTIHIIEDSAGGLQFLLNDQMMNLDRPIQVKDQSDSTVSLNVTRTIANLVDTMVERDDPRMMFPVILELPSEGVPR